MTDKLDHSLDPMWDKLKADGEKLGLDYGQNKELYDKIRTEVAKEIFEEIEKMLSFWSVSAPEWQALKDKYTNKEE